MKIIKAKFSTADKTAYINANSINSFHVFLNENGRHATKIYLDSGKCEIDGDHAEKIASFMMNDNDCGLLDLTENGTSFMRDYMASTHNSSMNKLDNVKITVEGKNNNGAE